MEVIETSCSCAYEIINSFIIMDSSMICSCAIVIQLQVQ